ncbi:hypothetical protein [Alkaliphilus metalliredigens]|nr:hypothetical protein [Alkaliphilus metalliredigens]
MLKFIKKLLGRSRGDFPRGKGDFPGFGSRNKKGGNDNDNK